MEIHPRMLVASLLNKLQLQAVEARPYFNCCVALDAHSID